MTLRDLTAKITLEADTSGLDRIEHALEGVNRKLEFLAASEFVHWIGELAERYGHFGEQTENAAAAAGLTAEKFQALSYAAVQSGVAQDEMREALARLSRTLGAAREGSKGAVAQFARLGISEAQAKSFRDSGEALQAVADRVAGIQDPIKRTQALMAVLGRGSARMTKLLSDGGEGIRKQMQEAVDSGAVVSDANVKNLAELEESFNAFGQVIKATMATFAAAFGPAIRSFVHDLQKVWIANRQLVEVNFRRWAYDITYALGFVSSIMMHAMGALRQFIAGHAELVKAGGAIVLSFGAVSLALTTAQASVAAAARGFAHLTEIVGTAVKVFSSPFKIIAALGEGLGMVLGGLLQVSGLLISTYLPALGAAITAVGNALLGLSGPVVALGLAAMVTAAHDLYAYFVKGANLEDLWLYKLFMFLKGQSVNLLHKLGLDVGGPAKSPAVGSVDADGVPTLLRSIDAGAAQMQATVAPMRAAYVPPPAAAAGAQIRNISIEAPITFNLPADVPPDFAIGAVKGAVKEHLDTTLRQAYLNTQTTEHS